MINNAKGILQKLRLFISHPIVRYYLRHPLILFKNRIIVAQLWLKRTIKRDINFDDKVRSDTPIDVVIAAIDKDYDVLVHVIDSIRKNVRHPIGDILIISPESEVVKKICKTKKYVFVDENTVLPITKKDINYTVAGKDRSGWLFQQLLKYAAEKYCKQKYYLVTEADTVFLRPRVFEQNGKTLFPCSNQLCHIPYFYSYKALLGKTIYPYVNFTSHHSLINKRRLKQLKRDIELYCKKPWYRAIIENIDKTEGSSVSDYETYGQYMYNNYKNEVELEDWSNISLKRSLLSNINKLSNKFARNYKTISFHSYNY
jgi:hypothetical protein